RPAHRAPRAIRCTISFPPRCCPDCPGAVRMPDPRCGCQSPNGHGPCQLADADLRGLSVHSGNRGRRTPLPACDTSGVRADTQNGKGTMGSEPQAETGGPSRTPRSEIRPAVSSNRKKEPVLLLDLSTSMNWGAANEYGPEWPDPGSRRAIVIEALHGLVRVLEREDSEAVAEQASGSDELGGLMTHGFANHHVEIGDLNSSNLERRLNEIKWGGKTYIMP